jgi:hypothetical protein
MPFKKPRFGSVFWTLVVVLGIAVGWFTGNLLYTVLWAALADWGFPMTEAKIVTYIVAHLVPFVLILLLGLTLFFLIRRHVANATEADAQKFVDIAPQVYRESYRLEREPGEALELWENAYYLVVGNSRSDGRTIRKVAVNLHFSGPAIQCPLKDNESTFNTDIKHGEWAYFTIGRVVTSEVDGFPVFRTKPAISKEARSAYQHNISIGHLSFEPGTANVRFSSGIGPDRSIWKFQIIVSAEDVSARTVFLSVDLRSAPAKIVLEL